MTSYDIASWGNAAPAALGFIWFSAMAHGISRFTNGPNMLLHVPKKQVPSAKLLHNELENLHAING